GIHYPANKDYAGLRCAPLEVGIPRQRNIRDHVLWRHCVRDNARGGRPLFLNAAVSLVDYFCDGRDEISLEVARRNHGHRGTEDVVGVIDTGPRLSLAIRFGAVSTERDR